MLNKLTAFLRRYGLVQPGERILCAVSGGADSMALLYAMVLLQERLGITVEAVHFNHHLRGAESDRDEAFVREFCHRYDIPLHVGSAEVKPGDIIGISFGDRETKAEVLAVRDNVRKEEVQDLFRYC